MWNTSVASIPTSSPGDPHENNISCHVGCIEQPAPQTAWSASLMSSLDVTSKDDSFKLILKKRSPNSNLNVFRPEFFESSVESEGLNKAISDLQLEPCSECTEDSGVEPSRIETDCKQTNLLSEADAGEDSKSSLGEGLLSPLSTASTVSMYSNSCRSPHLGIKELDWTSASLAVPPLPFKFAPFSGIEGNGAKFTPNTVGNDSGAGLSLNGTSACNGGSSQLQFLSPGVDVAFPPIELPNLGTSSFLSSDLSSSHTHGRKRSRLKRYDAAQPPSPEKSGNTEFLQNIRAKIRRKESGRNLLLG